MIIDATDLILGRLATKVAKKALQGEKVDVTNCEKVVITGNKKEILGKYKAKRAMGQPRKGPVILRRPDMFVKRAIRGMLPYKQEKGRKALERIKCYLGEPEGKKGETIKEAHLNKLPNLKYLYVETICKELGYNG